ncbi:malonyl-CoA-acyl carrier protein transacylase, mitochondrial-like [Saccoglossus kowalevskii]|uniref:Malonyl-CoA-acyl carrier protein transacylase, mitochondrial-like n=1 Tax=Saccoglossus kowalevskii TaxID=10224 RepID=A0ABM0GLI0_SACKO|nr:PREDICTED: malonyl-CoA-acyl carrier protein transacylase, mitochondrial-like [Saccoglossus kowalevskii]
MAAFVRTACWLGVCEVRSCSLFTFSSKFASKARQLCSKLGCDESNHTSNDCKKITVQDSADKIGSSDLEIDGKQVKELLDSFAKPDIAEQEALTGLSDENSNLQLPRRKPAVDPADTSILLFPGQGSQFVGMGEKLLGAPNVKEIYQAASEILGYDLLELCLNGPKEELDKTIHCQPAVFVTSIAAAQSLQHQNPWAIDNCVATAGFSVGEFAALVFAGVMQFEDALRLVQIRAKAMQRASEDVASGMISVMGTHTTKYRSACLEARSYCNNVLGLPDPVCSIANYLFPDGRVIAGNVEALQFISENARQFGIRNVKRLPVSGAFHTSLMTSAQYDFREAIKDLKLERPSIYVISNVEGKRYSLLKQIKNALVKQIVSPVKWEQSMHVLYQRRQGTSFPQTFEVGPGKQLGALLKRLNLKAWNSYKSVEV